MIPVSPAPVLVIDTDLIHDQDSFHAAFAQACGFPDFYGKNMNAWVDCMTDLDDPDMSKVHVERGTVLTIQLSDAKSFATRCPALFEALLDASGFVNWRRLDQGDPAVLALSFHR